MSCEHKNTTPTGETEESVVLRCTLHRHRCDDCGETILVPEVCPTNHANFTLDRIEKRPCQSGKLVPTKIFLCSDCNREFSVR